MLKPEHDEVFAESAPDFLFMCAATLPAVANENLQPDCETWRVDSFQIFAVDDMPTADWWRAEIAKRPVEVNKI